MRAVESKGKEKKEKNSHPTKVAVFLCIKNSPCASTCPALWFPEFRTLQRKRFPKFRNCIFCMRSPCIFYLLLRSFVSVYHSTARTPHLYRRLDESGPFALLLRGPKNKTYFPCNKGISSIYTYKHQWKEAPYVPHGKHRRACG